MQRPQHMDIVWFSAENQPLTYLPEEGSDPVVGMTQSFYDQFTQVTLELLRASMEALPALSVIQACFVPAKEFFEIALRALLDIVVLQVKPVLIPEGVGFVYRFDWDFGAISKPCWFVFIGDGYIGLDDPDDLARLIAQYSESWSLS